MSNAQIAVAKDQLDLLAYIDSAPAEAFGETYDPNADGARLCRQALAVFRVMRRGDWITLPDLMAAGVPGMSSAHSARIRQIRKWLADTGRGTIEREHINAGLWRYRIVRTWPIYGKHIR